MGKAKKADKIELTEIEVDLLNGWLAQQENIRIKAQQALVDQHGSQCGFCTPGFVMSLFSMYHQPALADDAHLERGRIDEQLAGNLCRCTGYAKIYDAVQAAARRLQEGGA